MHAGASAVRTEAERAGYGHEAIGELGVRTGVAMQRITHVPEGVPTELPQLLFSSVNPHDITACILSALLTSTKPDLAPTIGLIEPAVAEQHWTALAELGFVAAELNYEGTPLGAEGVGEFRQRFGNAVAAPEMAAAAV